MSSPINNIYTVEQAMNIQELKPLAENILRLEKNKAWGYRTRKYLSAQKFHTELKMDKLRLEYPDWQLKDVLAEIVKGYPADLPSDVLKTMTKFIIETWEKAAAEEEVAVA